MKLVVNLKLLTQPRHHRALLQTMERANAACVHPDCTYGEPDCQAAGRQHYPCWNRHHPDPHQQEHRLNADHRRNLQLRRLHFDNAGNRPGRQTIPYACSPRQLALLAHRRGETALVLRDKAFYLNSVIDVEEPSLLATEDVLDIFLA